MKSQLSAFVLFITSHRRPLSTAGLLIVFNMRISHAVLHISKRHSNNISTVQSNFTNTFPKSHVKAAVCSELKCDLLKNNKVILRFFFYCLKFSLWRKQSPKHFPTWFPACLATYPSSLNGSVPPRDFRSFIRFSLRAFGV